MPIENPTQPLMPFLKARRKRKLRAELFADSARVWREKDEARQVEVDDPLQQYAVGASALGVVVDAVEARLLGGRDDD